MKDEGAAEVSKNKYEIDMCNGTIMDKLISFAIPLMVSGILQLMCNAVDIIVVGRFTGSQALAAVGSTTALINMFINFFIGISLGANVLAARFYAAGKHKEMSETVHTAITLALISGVTNALLNMFLVIVFHMGVAGVAIATVISQLISCFLVLRCLYQTESSYQLRFSRLCIKKCYLIQIFQVGIPAGVQSTVINFSNVLLQSSVNSFGSTAMAGYTAANNILGFLYASVNAVTQACMSFTSQNYGVGKYKRMDRVLLDCGILSFVIALVLGCGSYILGGEILKIYTEDAEVIRCGVEILSITTVPYFLCGIMDLFPGALRGMGHSGVPMILSIIGTVGTRILWIFWVFPQHRSLYTLFISYPASWAITIVMQAVCFELVRRKVHGQLKGTAKAV